MKTIWRVIRSGIPALGAGAGLAWYVRGSIRQADPPRPFSAPWEKTTSSILLKARSIIYEEAVMGLVLNVCGPGPSEIRNLHPGGVPAHHGLDDMEPDVIEVLLGIDKLPGPVRAAQNAPNPDPAGNAPGGADQPPDGNAAAGAGQNPAGQGGGVIEGALGNVVLAAGVLLHGVAAARNIAQAIIEVFGGAVRDGVAENMAIDVAEAVGEEAAPNLAEIEGEGGAENPAEVEDQEVADQVAEAQIEGNQEVAAPAEDEASGSKDGPLAENEPSSSSSISGTEPPTAQPEEPRLPRGIKRKASDDH